MPCTVDETALGAEPAPVTAGEWLTFAEQTAALGKQLHADSPSEQRRAELIQALACSHTAQGVADALGSAVHVSTLGPEREIMAMLDGCLLTDSLMRLEMGVDWVFAERLAMGAGIAQQREEHRP